MVCWWVLLIQDSHGHLWNPLLDGPPPPTPTPPLDDFRQYNIHDIMHHACSAGMDHEPWSHGPFLQNMHGPFGICLPIQCNLEYVTKESVPYSIWYAYHDRKGFGNLMFSLWFGLFGGSFVFLDVSPSILFFIFPPFLGALVYLWLAGFHQLGLLTKCDPA